MNRAVDSVVNFGLTIIAARAIQGPTTLPAEV